MQNFVADRQLFIVIRLKILKQVFADSFSASIFAPAIQQERSVRLGVRTPDFHSGNRGSIPLRTTEREK